MSRLINTFKYGSWKTRLFFGTIALAFLGGAATIAVAAIAGLGIIPIAVGGAAMVLGLGMSTMVTVVSDDEKKNGEQTGPGNGEGEENGNGEGAENGENLQTIKGAEKAETGENPETVKGIEKADTGDNPEAAPGIEGNRNTERTGNPDKTGKENNIIHADDGIYIPDEIKEKPVPKGLIMKRVKNPANLSPSSGPFIDGLPPEKPEYAGAQDSVSVNTKQNGTLTGTTSRTVQQNGRQTAQGQNVQPGTRNISSTEIRNTVIVENVDGQGTDKLEEIEEPAGRRPFFKRLLSVFKRSDEAKAEKEARKKHLEDGKRTRRERRAIRRKIKEKTDIYGHDLEEKFENELSYADKEKLREEEYARQVQNRKADADTSRVGEIKEETGKKSAGEAEIKKPDIAKTDSAADSIKPAGVKTGEVGYMAQPVSRKTGVDGYITKPAAENSGVKGYITKPATENTGVKGYITKPASDDTADNTGVKGYITKPATENTGVKGYISKPASDDTAGNTGLKGYITKPATDVSDNTADNSGVKGYISKPENADSNLEGSIKPAKEEPGEDKAPEADNFTEKTEKRGTGRKIFGKIGGFFKNLFGNVYDEPEDDRKDNEPAEDRTEKADTVKKAPERPTFKRRSKTGEILPDEDEEEQKLSGRNEKADKAPENKPEEAPRPERKPGDELDVSKYTASNMKKIIKAKKLGKDFIPVFIESWKSQKVVKTPALCFVKDDKVHFLLLEGDMERDVTVQTDKFINVWYQKNVPETDMKAYKNIKDNMGAYEMFKNVMPAFTSSYDQMGATSYTVNLYLLGKDIALAPPSMRELRKRFRFNTNIFDSLNTRGEYSEYFKKAYENKILWTDNVIGIQEYQRRIRAILQEMVNDDTLHKLDFREDVEKMVQFRLITDEYAQFYLNMREKS